MIGSAEYQCLCVRYVPHDNIPLIVGLSVGLGLLLLLTIIIAVVLYRRRQSKQAEQGEQVPADNRETSMEQDNEETHYNRRLPDDYIRDADL